MFFIATIRCVSKNVCRILTPTYRDCREYPEPCSPTHTQTKHTSIYTHNARRIVDIIQAMPRFTSPLRRRRRLVARLKLNETNTAARTARAERPTTFEFIAQSAAHCRCIEGNQNTTFAWHRYHRKSIPQHALSQLNIATIVCIFSLHKNTQSSIHAL